MFNKKKKITFPTKKCVCESRDVPYGKEMCMYCDTMENFLKFLKYRKEKGHSISYWEARLERFQDELFTVEANLRTEELKKGFGM